MYHRFNVAQQFTSHDQWLSNYFNINFDFILFILLVYFSSFSFIGKNYVKTVKNKLKIYDFGGKNIIII
jgi:hypothetical protein